MPLLLSEGEHVRRISSRLVADRSIRAHRKAKASVPVFLVARNGLSEDRVDGAMEPFHLICRRLVWSRTELVNA